MYSYIYIYHRIHEIYKYCKILVPLVVVVICIVGICVVVIGVAASRVVTNCVDGRSVETVETRSRSMIFLKRNNILVYWYGI